MSGQDHFVPGTYNMACSMCGRKAKAKDLVRNWQGLWRHVKCNEARQPQDFARGVKEQMGVPFTQEESDTYVNICSINTQCSICDIGLAECMRPDNTFFDPQGV